MPIATTFSDNSVMSWFHLTMTSAPVLAIVAIAMLGFFWHAFLRVGMPSCAAAAVKETRQRQILSAMATALAWEQAAQDVKEREDEKNPGEAKKPAGQIKEEHEAKMPTAQHLFKLLFDTDEFVDTTFFGTCDTPAGAARVASVTSLLRQALQRELSEAISKTRKARTPEKFPLASWESAQMVQAYEDATKLKDLVYLAKREISKHGFKHTVCAKTLAVAEQVLREVSSQRAQGVRGILRLALPSFPMVIFATIVMMGKATVEPSVLIMQTRLLDQVASSGTDLDSAWSTVTCCIVAKFFFKLCQLIIDAFQSRGTNRFLGPLRTAISQALVRQDMEFYDLSDNNDLHSHLRACDELAWAVFRLPMEVVSCTLHFTTSAYIVWTMQPVLLTATLVPALGLSFLHYTICRRMHNLWRRRHGLNRMTEKCNHELIEKVATIREFAQEVVQSTKRQHRDDYSVEFEEWQDAVNATTWNTFGFVFEIQMAYMLYKGAELIGAGALPIGTFLAIRDQIHALTWTLRHLMELGPRIGKVE